MPKLVNVDKKSAKGETEKEGKSGKGSPLPEEMDVDLESLGSCDPLDPEKNKGRDKDALIDRWLDGRKGEKSEGGGGEDGDKGDEKDSAKKRKRGAKSDKAGGEEKNVDEGDGELKLPSKSSKKKRKTSQQPYAEQAQAMQMQAAALQAMGMQAMAMNPMAMALRGFHLPQPNPQMMMLQRMYGPEYTMQAATTPQANASANNPTGFNCRVVILGLPPGIKKKLGLVLEDNKQFGMPELKRVLPSSPVRDQIPVEFRQGCCVASMKSDRLVGHATPKTAKEAVEMINKCRLITMSKEGQHNPIKLEMLLIQTKVTTSSRPNPQLRDVGGVASEYERQLQAAQAARASVLPSQPQVVRPPNTGGPLQEVERRASPRKKSQKAYDSYKDWTLHFDALVEYKHSYGNFNVRSAKHPMLAKWCLEQREQRKQNKMTQSRRERLETIGFWEAHPPVSTKRSPKQARAPSAKPSKPSGPFPEPTWDERYESLERFRKMCGLLPKSGSLFEWIEQQKKEVESLSQVRVVKLHECGIDLGLPRERLEQMGVEFAEDDGGEANEGSTAKSPLANNPYFWQAAEVSKLFGCEQGDDVVSKLEERVALLRKANESVAGWKSLIPEDGKEEQYTDMDILNVRHKAQYLARSYLLAIEHMPTKRWAECCAISSKELGALGLKHVVSHSIQQWNVAFRAAEAFPHPGRLTREKKQSSTNTDRIFDYFPQAKEMFVEIANDNIDQMSGRFMIEQWCNRILPALEDDSREKGCFDDGSPEQNLLVKLMAAPPSDSKVRKWFKKFDITYDPQCTRRGKGGHSYLSQRMKEAWASGKYANRRPKGQGLKRGKQARAEEEERGLEDQAEEFGDLSSSL